MTQPPTDVVDVAPVGDVHDVVLEDQLCFALYSASRATTAAYAQVLDEHGLTYPQYLVLLVLWERQGEETTVGDLTQRLRLTTATVSPLLRRLEESGLVERHRGSTDARTVTVSLTARGRGLRSVARQAQQCLLAGLPLTVDEIVLLRDLATRLASHPDQSRTEQENR